MNPAGEWGGSIAKEEEEGGYARFCLSSGHPGMFKQDVNKWKMMWEGWINHVLPAFRPT